MSAARKPVIVRQLTRDWYAGYASNLPNDSADAPELELLDGSGKLMRIAWERIKWVCYVRELGKFSGSGPGNSGEGPERLLRRRFAARPRIAGVWLRLTLADGEELEGVAANDRSLLAGTGPGAGLLLTPPDTRSNTQRIFVPRSAIREMTILAVIQPKPASSATQIAQSQLFEDEPQPE